MACRASTAERDSIPCFPTLCAVCAALDKRRPFFVRTPLLTWCGWPNSIESVTRGQPRRHRAPQYVITAENLTKRYGDVTAVDGISFRVPAGEAFGLLGPNGAGKSTTMKMIGGVSQRTSGA